MKAGPKVVPDHLRNARTGAEVLAAVHRALGLGGDAPDPPGLAGELEHLPQEAMSEARQRLADLVASASSAVEAGDLAQHPLEEDARTRLDEETWFRQSSDWRYANPKAVVWMRGHATYDALSEDKDLLAVAQAPYQAVTLAQIHQTWCDLVSTEGAAMVPHPLAPLVRAYEERPRSLDEAPVTVAGGYTQLMRHPHRGAQAALTHWLPPGEVAAVMVDGLPVVAALSGPQRALVPWTEGRALGLGSAMAPTDWRLHATAAFARTGGPLPDDVRVLLTVAAAVGTRGVVLSDRNGAALLARSSNGEYRRPRVAGKNARDLERYQEAVCEAVRLRLHEAPGSANSRELIVSATYADGTRRLALPPWLSPTNGGPESRWFLSAEQGCRERASLQSLAARMVLGFECFLATRWDGKRTIGDAFRKVEGKLPSYRLDVPSCLALAGDVAWRGDDERERVAALKRFHRAVDALEGAGYFGSECVDTVRVISRTRGSRGNAAGVVIAATLQSAEAARKANQAGGKGFESVRLADYLNGPKFRPD